MISHRAARTISDIEDEDEEKSEENRWRPRAQLQRIDKARERGNNTGTAAGSSEGGLPRLCAELASASICRYSPRVRYYRT